MTTLKQLYQQFGHDPKWTRFAVASTLPMVCVYLRKLGGRDIRQISGFDLQLQLAMSDQPKDRKAKAEACMRHLLAWAAEHGYTDIPSLEEGEEEARRTMVTPSKPCPEPATPPEREKRLVKRCSRRGDVQIPRQKNDTDTLTAEDWAADTRWRTGSIVQETVSKGWKGNRRAFRDRWRATIQVNYIQYHYRAKTRTECKAWLDAVLSKKILPTDTKSDWWRMEQHKDEEARIDELIVSAAEEANLVYEYRQTGDTKILYDYCIKALLPHMVWYCCHSLKMPKDRTLTSARQAVGLILTKIVGGRPVTNITFTCKRMLRIYKNRGDFWYYDKAPEQVKLMVNRIDMSALADLYKVTKDRRL